MDITKIYNLELSRKNTINDTIYSIVTTEIKESAFSSLIFAVPISLKYFKLENFRYSKLN
jgi:hypothetical protein